MPAGDMSPDEAARMLDEIDQDGHGLTDWEVEFVDSMLKKSDDGYAPSAKEAGIIRSLHMIRVRGDR